MARPLRLEFSGALYHLTARGNARQKIFFSDADRQLFMDTLAGLVFRYGWICHAYCLMANHYHLLVETPEANLVAGMKWLQGAYTQRYNRRHKLRGHLFQGRVGLVAARGDDRLIAVGERTAGDGALHASDAGNQPPEAASGAKARAVRAQVTEVEMKGKTDGETKCHDYRTDPFDAH